MRVFRQPLNLFSLISAIILIAVFVFFPAQMSVVQAQDDMPVVCDSTLVVLLLVAEHDYDYLSSMMDSDMEIPNLDLGQFDPLITDIMSMMMDMMDNMSEEEMASMEEMDAMLEPMMAMDTNDILAAWGESMGMDMNESMTTLTPGNIEGEDPLCASVRADVERFLVAHIVTESEMMMMDDQ